MKYIELPSLSGLASSLSHQGPECNVSVRLEAYSCKNIKRDKRLFRDLEKVYWDNMGVLEGIKYDPLEESSKSSPTEGASSPHSFLAQAHSSLSTPFGPLGSPQSRKTLHLLIATLNVAFPDYTFDSVKPSSFTHLESGAHILNALSTTLLASRASTGSPTTMAYGAYPATQGLGFGAAQGSPESPYDSSKRARSPRRVSSLAHILKSTRFSTTSLDRSTNAKSLNTFQSQKRIPTRRRRRG
ncbi:Maf1-domain-containing protein [Gymnopus androsaceus JB14]|uniref:Maf1-domain-containing protein n=1 Tax=Gymnopus androsaceus JB14 TaxID=1447944 RepID=A0A6A4IFR1_9AGAR|nr:Maf1-domain-containing protein [Gymnopus androsaceus JB14]